MSDAEYVAHVLNPDGVTPTRFVRDGARWTNAEQITIRPGGTLDFGNGLTLSNAESLPFDATLTLLDDDE